MVIKLALHGLYHSNYRCHDYGNDASQSIGDVTYNAVLIHL